MSEKFLSVFFSKLKVKDFQKDKFLHAFRKFYKKEKSRDVFECYLEYITRNMDFKEDEREIELRKICDDIKNSMISQEVQSTTDVTYETAFTQVREKRKPTKFKISKERALEVISDFIKQSFIRTEEDPEKEYDEKNEAFMEETTNNIVDEIQKDGRTMPEPKKDVVFGQRSEMLNIWFHTRQRCQELMENKQLATLVSKIFYIDISKFTNNNISTTVVNHTANVRQGLFAANDSANVPQNVTQSVENIYKSTQVKPIIQQSLDTVVLKTDDGKETILPGENFVSTYSNANYNTTFTFSNNHPLLETMNRAKQKIRCLYICSGSQNICGSNADQGIDVAESMLYMTSSYSMSLERALHAFPIKNTEVILCPSVLVFKDTEYKMLTVNNWQKIAVMMAPSKYRPKTNLKDPPQNDCELDDRLYDKKTEMTAKDYDRIKTNLVGSIELALFFGYDTVIIDDLSISDNWLPAHQIANIIRESYVPFKGRLKELVVCANKAKSFNIFKLYMS